MQVERCQQGEDLLGFVRARVDVSEGGVRTLKLPRKRHHSLMKYCRIKSEQADRRGKLGNCAPSWPPSGRYQVGCCAGIARSALMGLVFDVTAASAACDAISSGETASARTCPPSTVNRSLPASTGVWTGMVPAEARKRDDASLPTAMPIIWLTRRYTDVVDQRADAGQSTISAPLRDKMPLSAHLPGDETTPPDQASRADETLPSLLVLAYILWTAICGSLVTSMIFFFGDYFAQDVLKPASDVIARPTPLDYEQRCRLLLRTAATLWRRGETAVFGLDDGLPLRTVLLAELKSISSRLASNPVVQATGSNALTVRYMPAYWRALCQDVSRTVRDLERICAVAEAGRASFGNRENEPRIPKTLEEAYFALGANPGVAQETLLRLVRALRQCWHPDLAQTDPDRRYREARIRQINVANDIIRSHLTAA